MTYEIIEDAIPGYFRVRIAEDDGSCVSEPLYPDTLAPTSESKDVFGGEILARTVASRAAQASAVPEENQPLAD
jgi:hypothetical protein